MRIGLVASVALSVVVLGCAAPDAPEAPAPAAATAKPRPRPSPPPKDAQPKEPPAPTLPTIVPPKAEGPPDARRQETPCDRNETGWKWTGGHVEDGRCTIGPCTCVQG
jgi:hypothetical protein